MATPEEGAAAVGRCSRADCTSLREELELLRGDLLEIEGENEQLHEQLATLQTEATTRDVRTQRTLLEKDSEIIHLKETVTSLSTQLQQQLEKVQPHEPVKTPEEPKTKPLEQENDVLKAKIAILEGRLKELQAQVEREATAGLKAQRIMAQVTEESKDKRSELYLTLKENEMLREETRELQETASKTSEQVKEYQVSILAMQDQLEAYRDAVDEQTLEITQLHTKVEELEQEKMSVEAKLIEMDERESDVDALMGDAKAKFEMEKAVLLAELDEIRRKLKQQQMLHEQQQLQVQESKKIVKDEEEDIVRVSGNADLDDLEKQLEMLQELRVRDKSTILELNQRILQQQSDLESLAEHLNVDAVVESAVETALHKQKLKQESLEKENATLKRRLKEQRELAQDLELRMGIIEKQLVEAEEWNARYEQQAGLEDVVKYQKKLRTQLEQQQQSNIKLRQQLNEQVEAAGRLHIAFERLKAEAGKPASFEYDDLAVADHLKGQLAINAAVVKQMEIQIHELEADRLRFLQKLRDQARLTGHKLYEQHGLSIEQWSAVEEFIDRVKETPEVATRLLQTNCELMGVRDKEQSERQAELQQDAIEELERKLDISCEENALLLKDIGRLQNELEVAQSKHLAPVLTEQVTGPDDVRGELIRALESAKSKSQRQEGVIYHLRGEIASLRKDREQKGSRKGVSNVAQESVEPIQNAAEEKPVTDLHDQASAETQTSPHPKKSKSKVEIPCGDDDRDSSLSQTDEEEKVSLSFEKKSITTNQAGQPVEKHSIAEQSHSPSTVGGDWNNQADSIAQIVAKAIEAQFALLHSQSSASLSPVSSVPHVQTLKSTSRKATQVQKIDGDVNPDISERDTSPLSPVGRVTVDNAVFESEEEMLQQIDCLRELNVCLDELVVVEARNEELEQQLHQHEQVFQTLMDQHTILYQHFFQIHAQYTNAEIKLRREMDVITEENKDFKIKCQRYEAGLHLLGVQDQQSVNDSLISGNEAQLRSEIIELTRKTASYEVNEARLTRKYQQLHNEWHSTTEHNKLLQREWSEMEKTLKYRVLYLETWKQGADEMIERMEKTLEKSVLRDFADKQQRVVADVLKKYSALSANYAKMHVKYLEMCDLPVQLSRTQHSLMKRVSKMAKDKQAQIQKFFKIEYYNWKKNYKSKWSTLRSLKKLVAEFCWTTMS
ncbi:Centrosome-associated protein [Phytophthora megakarya]|uniref:Centrosome-associated protein n=1 Tax=Phytophthora megakarya TaxID=4795 RepID=A0A225VK13_9STRA|nr:Centrosome-associated protein [Phytophthora megakarya]